MRFLYTEDFRSGFKTVMKKFSYLKQYKIIDLDYCHFTRIEKIVKIIKSVFFQNNLDDENIKGKEWDKVQKQ